MLKICPLFFLENVFRKFCSTTLNISNIFFAHKLNVRDKIGCTSCAKNVSIYERDGGFLILKHMNKLNELSKQDMTVIIFARILSYFKPIIFSIYLIFSDQVLYDFLFHALLKYKNFQELT